MCDGIVWKLISLVFYKFDIQSFNLFYRFVFVSMYLKVIHCLKEIINITKMYIKSRQDVLKN